MAFRKAGILSATFLGAGIVFAAPAYLKDKKHAPIYNGSYDSIAVMENSSSRLSLNDTRNYETMWNAIARNTRDVKAYTATHQDPRQAGLAAAKKCEADNPKGNGRSCTHVHTTAPGVRMCLEITQPAEGLVKIREHGGRPADVAPEKLACNF